MSDRTPTRNGNELFERMSPTKRERIYEMFRDYAWKHVTATACAANKDGERIMGILDPVVGRVLNDASLEVFMEDRT